MQSRTRGTLAFGVALASLVALGAQSPGYRIAQTFVLGGGGSWDYIVPDPPTRRLFIGRQNRVMVVNEDTGALLGKVTGIDGAHGTAIATASGRGFATSGNDASIVMFDLATYRVTHSRRMPTARSR